MSSAPAIPVAVLNSSTRGRTQSNHPELKSVGGTAMLLATVRTGWNGLEVLL